ncbi:MAG: hypothetical protein KKB70_05790, partial [Proteobacteria bacterium]|nr:hypothetical protein [Pseudomonadota bacterium]MBU1610253.1 hypothetical protein [Pseudomonadota bacterium]
IENGQLVVGNKRFDLDAPYIDLRQTGVTALPDGLRVKGDLDFSGCPCLVSLPDDLQVGGSLFLEDCTGLTSLPDDLQVKGSLWLDGCSSLVSLPDGLQVGGNVNGFVPKPVPCPAQTEPIVTLDDEAMAWLTTRADGGWIV